jgi:hypothetical protein
MQIGVFVMLRSTFARSDAFASGHKFCRVESFRAVGCHLF